MPTQSSECERRVILRLSGNRLPLAARHPQHARAREQHARWYTEQLIPTSVGSRMQPAARDDTVDLFVRAMSDAPAERIMDVTSFVATSMWLDDYIDSMPEEARCEMIATLVAVTRNPDAPTSCPEAEMWSKHLVRTRRAFPARHAKRVESALEKWLESARFPPSADRFNDLDSYLCWRKTDFACEVIPALVEYSADADLSDIYETDVLGRFHTACFEHAVLVNDLFSYRKEFLRGEESNALIVLTRAGADIQLAADTVCERVNRAETAFWSLGDALRTQWPEIPRFPAYLDAFARQLGGNLAWSMNTPRYHGEDHQWSDIIPGHLMLPGPSSS